MPLVAAPFRTVLSPPPSSGPADPAPGHFPLSRPAPAALTDPARLAALDATGLLTAGPAAGDGSPALARVARLAAQSLGAPVGQVNLVTADQQAPVAAYVAPGFGAGEDAAAPDAEGAAGGNAAAGDPLAWRTPVSLAASLCQYVVRAGAPLVLDDAREDPVARDNEAVTRAGLVGYCAVPLRAAAADGATPGAGPVIGSVCAVDTAPRRWTAADIAVLQDLAGVAEGEVARATAERRLAALADAMPLVVWTAAPDGRTTYLNRRWAEVTGQDPAAGVRDGTAAYVHPDDLPTIVAAWRRRLPGGDREGQDFTFEYRLRTRGGGAAGNAYRWYLGRLVGERDADGRLARWVGTGTDVDDQKWADAERARLLAESEAARAELEAAAAQLAEQGLELELQNQQLQEQAVELEASNEELQATATQLEEQTEAAEAERARAAGILEGMADAYFLLDAGFRIAAVNAAMARGTGLARDQLLGRDFRAAFPGAVGTALEREYRRVAAGGGEAHFTHDYSDGRLELVADIDAYPTPGGGVAVFWRDVTARRRAEAAVAASDARYQALLTSVDVGFCVLELLFDGDGPEARPVDYRILETNPAFVRQTGFPPPFTDPVGRRMREIAPDLEAFWYETYGRVARTGEPVRFTHTAAALGSTFEVFAYRVDAPALGRVAVLFTDVTARRAAEAERERLLADAQAARAQAEAERAQADAANQAKGLFLANMSHELRTPLNAIGGYAQLLDMGLHGPVTEDQRGALSRIQGAQTRLLSLINDILNYAKLESGRVEYDVAAVDVADVVRDVAPLVEPQMRAKGLAFGLALPEQPCVVWADREKLGQVLVNLLSNAVKFTSSPHPTTGEPGRVTVSVAARDGGPDGGRPGVAFLRVADTGRGIPRPKQDSIFEPFVQVRTGYAQATEGTGLGLAISRDLARGMGGDLRVRSREGVGSTFTVTLRRVVDAEGHAVDRRTGSERRDDEERRVGEDRRHGDPRPDA